MLIKIFFSVKNMVKRIVCNLKMYHIKQNKEKSSTTANNKGNPMLMFFPGDSFLIDNCR